MVRSRSRLMVLLLLAMSAWLPTTATSGTDDEFERICGQASMGVELPRQQLETLARESDALLRKVVENPGAEHKVYIFRLTKCRDFFQYLLETRKDQQDP